MRKKPTVRAEGGTVCFSCVHTFITRKHPSSSSSSRPSPSFSVSIGLLPVTLSLSSHSLSNLSLSQRLHLLLTFLLTWSQPLGRSVSLHLRLCMILPFIRSPIIVRFYHRFPIVQSGSAERSSGTEQTARTAHNFSSFDSD